MNSAWFWHYPPFLRAICLVALFVSPLVAQPARQPKDAAVWVVDDTDKVHPISGNLLSEGINVYSGKRSSTREYRTSNTVWDGATSTVKLFSGRNEFVSFQIVLEKRRDDLHKVFINATDLLGSRARISADSHIRMFRQLYLELGGIWYPDALVPFEVAGTTPLELPDLRGPLGGRQRVQSVWVDIYVPHELPAGAYSGQVSIVHRATDKQAILEIELEVGEFTLADELHLDVDLMNYGFLNVERGWPNMVLDGSRHRAIEREFFRAAHQHRMTFAIVPYNHDGSIPKGLKPELAGAGETIRVADWTAWDERFGPLLSGEAFADLPRAGQPVGHFFLPHNLMWPSDMRHWQKPTYRTECIHIGQAFRAHLLERGWTKPKYQVYYNHKKSYLFFPWDLDEPTEQTDLDALRYLGAIVKEAFPNKGPLSVLFRLDIGHFFCRNAPHCTSPKEASERVINVLGPLVDLWNMSRRHNWPNLAQVRKLKAQGKSVYYYSSSNRVQEPLLQAVVWGWYGYKYEADGACFWNATDWTDWSGDAAPQDPYTNAGGEAEGSSMLFYPGSKFGYDGPIPSIRLKAMRRGFQDFEYLRLIEKRGLRTRQELIQMADLLLLANEADLILAKRADLLLAREPDYPRLRRAMYELLAGSQPRAQ